MEAQRSLASKKKVEWNKIKQSWQLYVFALPAFVLVLVFSYFPMYGIIIAFQNFRPVDGFWGSQWVGFQHFSNFFSSHHFWRLMTNTFMISFYGLVAGFPVPIILALAFNELRDSKFKKISQTVTYAPHFISTVVFAGMIISFASPTIGIANHFLGFLGIEPIAFLQRPELFRHVYVWTGIWQSAGWGTIIYLAALSGVDPSMHEAATIDGATRWQRNRYINLPTIMPTIIILLILNVGSVMSVGFERILLLHNSQNASTADVISLYVFQVGIMGGQFSFAAAVGLFNNVINAVLMIAVNIASKKASGVSVW